jgi:hypothetical protein
MLVGTPSVTTQIGAEGICENLPWNGVVASDSQSFANSAVQLYQNEEKWSNARQNGISIINHFYNRAALHQKLQHKIKLVFQDLERHRANNFIGAMLLHHSLASTKYMSKWIAEKNSKS